MSSLSYFGALWEFPFLLCIIPVLFFIGMMFIGCRLWHRGRFPSCCNRNTAKLAEEVAKLNTEIQEIKKKLK